MKHVKVNLEYGLKMTEDVLLELVSGILFLELQKRGQSGSQEP